MKAVYLCGLFYSLVLISQPQPLSALLSVNLHSVQMDGGCWLVEQRKNRGLAILRPKIVFIGAALPECEAFNSRRTQVFLFVK